MQSKSSREEIISDFGSSEGQAMASILSSKKRRCSKRSRLSSESVCRGPMVEEAEKAEKDVGPGHEICSSAPYDMQTPRTSERLQRKRTSRSFSLPSREKVLHSMLCGIKLKNIYSQKRIRQLRPRKLVNNFLREHTSYVCREDEYYDSDDAGMSDWIDDDDDADDDDDDESTKSTLESDCREVRCRLQKKSVEASTSESIENCESDDDIPLSNVREKNLNSDSDDSLTKRTKGPIYSSTPYDMQTPGIPERLQRKPSREKVLDSMFSSVKLKNMYRQKRIRQLRPRKLV